MIILPISQKVKKMNKKLKNKRKTVVKLSKGIVCVRKTDVSVTQISGADVKTAGEKLLLFPRVSAG